MRATAQALVTLPVSLAGYLAACAWLHGQQAGFPLPRRAYQAQQTTDPSASAMPEP
jgi:hypothetical protein